MNVNQHDNDTYSIVFADGSVFHDVAVCDENFEKLTEINQEKVINNEKIQIEECEEIKKTIFGKNI